MASGKILIVDDDTNICELLRLYIEKEGFEVSIANDGETALKMFDTVNPGFDPAGHHAARPGRLAGLPGNSEKSSRPIIMLTAKGEVLIRFWAWSWERTTM